VGLGEFFWSHIHELVDSHGIRRLFLVVVFNLFIVIVEDVKSGNLNIDVFIRWAFIEFSAPILVGSKYWLGECSNSFGSVHHQKDGGSQESSGSDSDEG